MCVLSMNDNLNLINRVIFSVNDNFMKPKQINESLITALLRRVLCSLCVSTPPFAAVKRKYYERTSAKIIYYSVIRVTKTGHG